MPKSKTGHKEQELDIKGEKGNLFRIILRQSNLNIMSFSVILVYLDPKSNIIFRLRRYNGKSHLHSNVIEKHEAFYDFHIHYATERYQKSGYREDSYAEPTNRYSDLHGAIQCLIEDCAFLLPPGYTRSLF